MAEENAEKPAEAAPAAPPPAAAPPQKPTLFIILCAINMAVVGVVGFMFYAGKKKDESGTKIEDVIEDKKDAGKHSAEAGDFIGRVIPLETFLVNLAGSRQKLVKINMELELNNEEVQLEIEMIKPKVRDVILLVLSSKTYTQVSSTNGKDDLRSEIRDKVNSFLTKGQINRVYFTEFIYN